MRSPKRIASRHFRTIALGTASAIILTVAGAFAVSAAAAPTTALAAAAPVTATLLPSADTYVYSRQADTNFGQARTLQLSRFVYHGLIRFNVPSPPAGSKITSAVLRLYSDQTLNGSYLVTVGTAGWEESTVDSANQPAWNSSLLGTSSTLIAGAYAAAVLPVASVSASGDVAFGLTTTAGLQAPVESRESAHPPQLIVSYTAAQTTSASASVSSTAATSSAASSSTRPTTTVPVTTVTATTATTSATVSPTAPAVPPGWVTTFSENFNTTVGLGSWPGVYSTEFARYTNALDTSGNGVYDSTKVISVHDGMMDMYIHSESGKHYVAAELPKTSGGNGYDGQTSGRYSVRFKADPIPGYKTAWLLWPNSGAWPSGGEIDFPEGNLDETITGASHYSNGGADAFDKFDSKKTFGDWHVATVEWLAGQSVKFYLDGLLVGTSAHAPTDPMHWVLQTETQLSGGAPADSAAGHVYIDWVTAWKKG